MPYDPNFPPDHQPLNGAPFRDQFNGLKDLVDALTAQVADLNSQLAAANAALAQTVTAAQVDTAIAAGSAGPLINFPQPNFTIHNPPTESDLSDMAAYFRLLYNALGRV